MKDKFIRLLKAIGIALLCFGALFLFVFGFVRYPDFFASAVAMALFIFVVWRIYKDADFL